jgi:peroxiredoxin
LHYNNFTHKRLPLIQRFVCAGVALLLLVSATAQTPKKSTTTADTQGYNITATVAPFKNTWLYLGTYYGKYKTLADSAMADANGTAVFKGDKKLDKGIYFLVSPDKAILFEIMMDDKQHFSVKADTAHNESVSFTGSEENTNFQNYTKFLAQHVPALTKLQAQLKGATNASDSAQIMVEITKENKALDAYREQVIKTNPTSMLALFFKSVKRPEVPAGIDRNSKDAFYYIKDHYWDDVPFDDARLLHTPFFDPKIDEYFKYYVSPEPDSIKEEVNYMLLSARTNKDMFQYLLGKFTDKYINPEIMGQDKVFLFLFDNYYSKGDTAWLKPAQRKYIFDRAYSLMANQIGEAAPILDLSDSSGKMHSLYDLQAPYTFVLFWDPNCSHCKIEVPRVDSIYKAKWQAKGVKVYAVNTSDAAVQEWKNFINEHHLDNWTHVYQTKDAKTADEQANRPNYRQLYDVFQTPTMYLLDKDKHIIAKGLSILQFDEVMNHQAKPGTK